MSDKVKVVIEIPKETKRIFDKTENDNLGIVGRAVKNGIPLDNDSERAEVQAYFDGQAYGWEQGRKALIEELKAEIEKHQFSREYCCDHNIDTAIDMGMVRIILGNIESEEV